ncbi:MAG: SIMPL domain-containing protein, partial [Thermoproteota archaeon]|nr:SIMPL domain-containing protein [Thermoproteota archaeon]
ARWIDTAISSGGATSVNSIGFTLSDKKLQEIKNGLIKQAINNARSKADIAASALGLKVLGIKSMYLNEFEQPPTPPQPILQKQSLAPLPSGAVANGTPIISGQQDVSVSVSADWLVK